MTVTQDLVTIPLADEELISLLREEPLSPVIRALRRQDPQFRAQRDGPVLDAAGLHVGPRSYGPTAQFLGLAGHPREFHRVAAAIGPPRPWGGCDRRGSVELRAPAGRGCHDAERAVRSSPPLRSPERAAEWLRPRGDLSVALSRAEAADLDALVADYRIGTLAVAGRTRLALLLAARDGRLEERGREIRIRCAAGLSGCAGLVEPGEAELDHVVPESEGGATVVENLQVLCAACLKARFPTLP